MEKFKCPCCGQMTLEEEGGNDICPICGWEDDWWDSNNPDSLPTSNWLTLNEARKLFRETGKNILTIQREQILKKREHLKS